MASDNDHRRANRWLAGAQVLILLVALAVAAGEFLGGDGKRDQPSVETATVPVPAIPWRPHPPLEAYR